MASLKVGGSGDRHIHTFTLKLLFPKPSTHLHPLSPPSLLRPGGKAKKDLMACGERALRAAGLTPRLPCAGLDRAQHSPEGGQSVTGNFS